MLSKIKTKCNISTVCKRWNSTNRSEEIRKTTKLKKMLYSKDLSFIMEAHNGLSAKIVENTGFEGIWASGLSISASMGVRDSNEASWTQVLDHISFMSDVTSIPILLDADTGYGNFNNARRLVRKLEERGIAGMCIEDKLFPKTNSFLDTGTGKPQKLAAIDEFCGKIQACKDTQRDEDFMVVARLESFIAGEGLEDALERGYAYAEAGADAILVHSKINTCKEIESYIEQWDFNKPIVVVPTKYYTTPTDRFRDLGVSLIIWANHNMRSCITSMKNISETIYKDESLINIEKTIASVNDVFELTDNKELQNAEKIYLNYSYDKNKSGLNKKRKVATDSNTNTQTSTNDNKNNNNKSGATEKKGGEKLCAQEFSDGLRKYGISNYFGVPDSVLKEWLLCVDDNDCQQKLSNVVTANEGLAVSMGIGYHLMTNKTPLIYLQNSGFGNLLNPLLSMVNVYKIPMLFVVGWRGEQGINDEPQHNTMGYIQESLLKTLNMKYSILDDSCDSNSMELMIKNASEYMSKNNEAYCILVKKGTFSKYTKSQSVDCVDNSDVIGSRLKSSGHPGQLSVNVEHGDMAAESTLMRYDVLKQVACTFENGKFFTTTGYTSRELYDIRENYYNGVHCNDFYMVGGMGHCSSVAVSASLVSQDSKRKIVCVDGDGSMLMHMGSLSTVGLMAKDNFVHILINNGCHESTGKQKLYHNVNFTLLAQGVGFESHNVYYVDNEATLKQVLNKINNEESDGAVFIEIKTKAGTIENLRRPKHNYVEQKEDFIKQVQLDSVTEMKAL